MKNQQLKSKSVIFSLTFLTFAFLLLTLGLSEVKAEGVSLSTYPSTIQLRAQPPTEARSGFTLENKSTESIKLIISLKPFKADTTNDGKLVYIEGNDPALFKKVQILDNGSSVTSIELGPKQIKQLNLQIAIDEKEPEADYYFSVIFLADQAQPGEETATDATATSIAQAGIALNVLLHVGPNESPNGALETFTTESFRTSGPVPFTVTLRNNGKHYFTPKGVILIKNIFGQTVGKIDLQNANILAGTSRSLSGIPYQQSAKKNTAFSSKIPTWPEKFLLGFYTAELSIALSEEGPVLSHSTKFLAVPVHVFIGIAIVAIIILFLTLRIRRKLRES